MNLCVRRIPDIELKKVIFFYLYVLILERLGFNLIK